MGRGGVGRSRDAMIANRRAKAEIARGATRDMLPDVPEHDLMGGSDSFQAQYVRRQRGHKPCRAHT
jgi:hypothetical protein